MLMLMVIEDAWLDEYFVQQTLLLEEEDEGEQSLQKHLITEETVKIDKNGTSTASTCVRAVVRSALCLLDA